MKPSKNHKNVEVKIVPISNSKFPSSVLINYRTWIYDNEGAKGLAFAENVTSYVSYAKKFIKANKAKLVENTPFDKESVVFDLEIGDPFNNIKEKDKIKLSLDLSFEIKNNLLYPLQTKKVVYYTIIKFADTVIDNFDKLNVFEDSDFLTFRKRRN